MVCVLQDVLRGVQARLARMLRYCRELLAGGRGMAQREAYVSLCDLLVVFGRQLRACGQLAALVSSPDPVMQQALQVRGRQWGGGAVLSAL